MATANPNPNTDVNDIQHLHPVSQVISDTGQVLYNGYNYPTTPFTPYQPQGPHPTPVAQTSMLPPPFILQSASPPLPPPPKPLQTNVYDKMEEKLSLFMQDIQTKLAKLDILDDFAHKLSKIEQHCLSVDKEIIDMKQQFANQNDKTDSCMRQSGDLNSRLIKVEEENRWLAQENWKLRERIIETESRSMRENLIFKGIHDVDNIRDEEDTEGKVKTFIRNTLEIEEDMKFHVVHRLKQRPDGKPRNIIAKFESRKDRNMVLEKAIEKLKNNDEFAVHAQYPAEVIERRRALIPTLIDARKQNHNAVLREDKLYIDGRRYIPPPPPPAFGPYQRPPNNNR